MAGFGTETSEYADPLTRGRARLLMRIATLTVALTLVAAGAAHAATITVNTTSDVAASPGNECSGTAGATDCSLRQAIDAAAGGDTVQLGGSAGSPVVYKLTLGSTIVVNKSLTIQGGGPAQTTIDGSLNKGPPFNERFRTLKVTSGTVSISGMSFTGAADAHDDVNSNQVEQLNGGGAISNQGGALTLSNVAFSNNNGSDNPIGGAISNVSGTLGMTDVSFSQDGAGEGGGMLVRGGTVTGTGVTFASEGGEFGGGAVLALGGTLSLTNTTIVDSGNASAIGGGIDNRSGTVHLLNDTLSGNARGSLETDFGTTTVQNTIIGAGFSDNTNGDCVMPPAHDGNGDNVGPAVTTDLGHNIDQDGSCKLTRADDKSGPSSSGDPKLAPLADNGGKTQTQALLSGSVAIDAGDPSACPATDQRGVARPQPGRSACDIGAFEAIFHGVPTTSTTGAPTGVTTSDATLHATINLDGEAGAFFFKWGTDKASLTNTTSVVAAGVVSTDTAVSQDLPNLLPGRTYYVQAVADNASGTLADPATPPTSFTTPPAAPTVQTQPATGVFDQSATLNANVDPNGADTTYSFHWGTDPNNLNQQAPATPADIGATAGSQQLTQPLSGLAPNTTYYYDTVATNPEGTVTDPPTTSSPSSFTTGSQFSGVAGSTFSQQLDNGNGCPASATVDWGDGSPPDTNVTPSCNQGSDITTYTLNDSHTYAAAGHYDITITYDNGNPFGDGIQVSPPAGGGGPPPGGNPGSGPGPTASSASTPNACAAEPHGPTVTITSDQGTAGYEIGDPASVTVAAHGVGLLSDPSAAHIPISTAKVGTFSLARTATDQCGTTTASFAYVVLPRPTLGKTVNVQVVSGLVRILINGHFVPLTAATQVPVGSTLDATLGTVSITTATANGKLQTGEFGGGIFKIVQNRLQRGLTQLNLIDNQLTRLACTATGAKAGRAQAARLSSRVLGLLNGSAHGRFSTRGRYSAATIRGTIWSVADRCDGTLTHVTSGVVSVRDFRRKKNVAVSTGKSYLARAA